MTSSGGESEAETRRRRINTRLTGLSQPWQIVRYVPGLNLAALDGVAVEELPTANGPADYALLVGGKVLGFIEAKKVSVNPQNVLEQAKRYAEGTTDGVGDWHGLRVPFLFSSNGELTWFLDTRPDKPASRPLQGFFTPAALAGMFARDIGPARKWLLDTPVETIARLRDYQGRFIEAVESNLLAGRREMLVASATGTGKTFMTVALLYRLLASGFARRILFLVDRKALAAQAVREFNSFNTPTGGKFTGEYELYSQRFQREDLGDEGTAFDPKVLPTAYLTHPTANQTFVYVSTIQRMARNLFGAEGAFPQSGGDTEGEDDSDRLDIPIHAFDLIVADECHRGYTAQETSIWRATLNHFDAVRVGLTATPAAHTVALFGEPVFRYGVEEAIRDGYLVDYDAVALRSEVRLSGAFLKEGEQVGRVDTETGAETLDQLEDERAFADTDIERRITAPESNRKIIREIARHAYAHEKETGRFPKVLIFAVNDVAHTSHADALVRLCREEFKQGDSFVQKITGNPNVDRPLQRIREFRNRPAPKVVVTVDMLSTGVDIPALEFIVFLRPVKSRILWEQMLGRGTRRCDEIHKTRFVIFDCFDGTLIQYFRNVSNFQIEAPSAPVLSLPQVIEKVWQNVDRDYHVKILVKRLRRIEKDMSGPAREEFAKFLPDGDVGRLAGELPKRLSQDFSGAMKLLRDPAFLDLLLNYERARRTFLVGYGVKDEVSSRVMERYGAHDTAEGYLEAFTGFVRDHRDGIEALRILLARPKDWKPEALTELRRTLRQHDYAEDKLRRAHAAVYHKSLADIISMVKHAASQEQPILTAEERVSRAVDGIVAAHDFDPEQAQWLGYIRQHLLDNLSIDADDLDTQPVFSNRGGLFRARNVFGNGLDPLLAELNFALAS